MKYVLVWMGLLCGIGSAAGGEDAAALIDRYEASLQQRVRLATQLEYEVARSQVPPSSANKPSKRNSDSYRIRVLRDLGRCDIDYIQRPVGTRSDKFVMPPVGTIRRGHMICKDKTCLWFWTRSSRRSEERHRTDPQITDVVFDPSSDNGFSDNVAAGPLDGYFLGNGGLNWAEVLRLPDSTVNVEETIQIDDAACQIINATTPYGRISLALAVNQGYIPLRVTISKAPDDRWNERQTLKEREYATYQVTGWNATLTDVVVQKMGEVYVPTSGTMRAHWDLVEGGSEDDLVTLKRTDVVVNPDYSQYPHAFVLDAADDTIVRNFVSPKTSKYFIYRGGQVVEGVPDFGPTAPTRHFPRQTALKTYSTIGFFVALVAFALEAFRSIASRVRQMLRAARTSASDSLPLS